MESRNVWKKCQSGLTINIDYDMLESLFEFPNRINSFGSENECGGQKFTNIDPKKLFSMNIILRRMKRAPEEICDLIKTQNVSALTVDALKQIQRALPSIIDETKIVKSIDFSTCANPAERFILLLMEIPHYRLLIRSMIFMEEFESTYSTIIEPVFKVMKACDTVINSTALVVLMKSILLCGNFLNKGSRVGNAFGADISNLHFCLNTLKGKTSDFNLLMFLLCTMKISYPKEYATLMSEMFIIEDSIKTNIQEIIDEMTNLEKSYEGITMCLDPLSDETSRMIFRNFNEIITPKIKTLRSLIVDMNMNLDKLGQYFCVSGSNINKFDILCLLNEFKHEISYVRSVDILMILSTKTSKSNNFLKF
ncbi:Inverted formin-2 [Thelohanellus kitauei]|uniref:Inverted formin-2 n=1 Tax=Thelohanellus kitauei TaxID=669202 RepID=A0A0C2IVX1_THEKT|nr:Inverted formin-2 [Thelohanellus kitauei]